MKCIKSTVIRN